MGVLTVVNTRTHVLTGFANKYLICEECRQRVPYWHNNDVCGCDDPFFNHPCGHVSGVVSTCPDWNSVDGCCCKETCK